MSAPLHLTLPNRPVTVALDPDALPRYLTARGWVCDEHGTMWRKVIGLYCHDLYTHDQSKAIVAIADGEGRHPLDVLADLLPPSSAPVAWAHLSERQRADALAHLDSAAADCRAQAWAWRSRDDKTSEDVLAKEGQAAALLALAELGRRAL